MAKAAKKTAATKKPAAKKPVAKKAPAKKAPAKKHAPVKAAPPRKKTALVTGACGFAGSHMTDLLLERGYHVIATDLEGADRKFLNAEADYYPADITKVETLEPIFEKGIDLVFHPAAVFDYEAPWELCERVNVGGMKIISELSLRHKVKRLVLFSTVSVYGSPRPDEIPVKEDSPKRPGTNYEKSKWMQEEVAQEYQKKGLHVTIVRPSPVYGPRNMYGIATILFLIYRFPILPFPMNLDNLMVGVNVRDVVRAALFLAENEKAVGEVYNVIDNSRYTVREFITAICPALGIAVVPMFIPRELLFAGANVVADVSRSVAKVVGGRPFVEKDMVYYLKANYAFSNDKLRSLGFEFEYPDLIQGILETIDWYKENHFFTRNELWMKILARF